jgi:predicted membrane-bound spermidine synthase
MNTILYPDITIVSMVAGLFIPLVTGLITKLDAHSAVKAVSTAVLAVVVGLVNTYLQSPDAGIPAVQAVYAVVLAAVAAWASYGNFWKPTGVADAVQGATKDVGIG